MRRWMTVLMVAVFCMLPLTVVSAAEHVATGQGASERAALQAAMRSAVEAEVGVYLDSSTRIANYQGCRIRFTRIPRAISRAMRC